MDSGYLVAETNDAHPGLVRLYTNDTLPAIPGEADTPASAVPRHIVYFQDVSTARMHAHEQLHHKAVDPGSGLYRSTPLEVAAMIESIGLRQRRAYIDPVLTADPALERMIAQRRAKRIRSNLTWRIIGAIAVVFLIVKLLLGF